ncbi:glycosyltransferase [Limnoglobus roseus]|uniref:GT4 family glycosyltransferase n=1 Tax=Limnoglobus roseus TaxID=2598579 RepID=A0A5C1AE82_9BACT|nr:glycosyltransferase [Limnoglobus roseus]QEL15434.1 GT4 family glycosyltransferase [Limnoglobus roseus]
MSDSPFGFLAEPQPRPIRVGFVLHVMQVAGAEVLVKETIRRLGSRIVPTVFCLDKVGQLGEDHLAAGGDLVCFHRRPGRDFKVSWKLAREAGRRGIDVIHAHQYTPFFYAALAKPLTRPKPRLILTEHGRHYPDVVSPKRRAFNRVVLDRFADAVNACCEFSATALRDVDGFRGNRIEVIENGIEVDRYGPAADIAEQKRKLGLNPARRYVVHVARHHPVKDQPMLIRGFAAMAADVPDADLLLAGDGPQRSELEELVRSLGITDRVVFLGIRRDVPEVLKAAEVFALTSVSEAASLTLLEAMATGLPVVVTAVGGNPEIVRHEREGLLVPRGDWKACGDALRRLFREPQLAKKFGDAARQRAHEKYRLEQTIDAYHRLYRQVTGI